MSTEPDEGFQYYNVAHESVDFHEVFISQPKKVGIVLKVTDETKNRTNIYENIIPNLNKQTVLPEYVYIFGETEVSDLSFLFRTGIRVKHNPKETSTKQFMNILITDDNCSILDKRLVERLLDSF